MKKALVFEVSKLKRQKIWLLILFIPLVSVVLGLGNFLGNYEVLMDKPTDNGWLEAWTQITLFYGLIFLPVLSGIYAALVCRTDHLNGGWKLQFSFPISRYTIYFSKFIVVISLIFFTQLVLLLIYLIGGTMVIDDPIPFGFLFQAMLLSWIGTFSTVAFQLWLSYKIKSFSIPLGINLGLAIFVFVAYTLEYGFIFPMAQPAFAMAAPDEGRVDSILMLVLTMLLTLIIIAPLASWRFNKEELT